MCDTIPRIVECDAPNREAHIQAPKPLEYQPVPFGEGARPCEDRLKMVLDVVGNPNGFQFLDIGSSTGWFCRELAKRGASVLGMEEDPGCTEKARQYLEAEKTQIRGKCVFLCGKFDELEDEYDYVLFLSVLHYYKIAERQAAFDRVSKLCKRGMFFEYADHHGNGDQTWTDAQFMAWKAGFGIPKILGKSEAGRTVAYFPKEPQPRRYTYPPSFRARAETSQFDSYLALYFDLATHLDIDEPLVKGLLGKMDLQLLLCETATLPPGLVLEAGGLGGRATVAMAMTNPDLRFLCVDRWRKGGLAIDGDAGRTGLSSWESVREALRRFNLYDRVTCIEGESEHILPGLELVRCVAVFHDGAHDYRTVRSDVEWMWPMVLPGGKFLAHDYHDLGTGVKPALDEYFSRRPKGEATITEQEHGIFVAIKNKESK